jgi:colanic acid biosynthesis glycosyl transferase WcaI
LRIFGIKAFSADMKVLLLHMRFHPDVTGTAPLVTALASDLVEKGDQVTVIASAPHYGLNGTPASCGKGSLRASDFQGVRVYRTWVHLPKDAGGRQRSLNYLSYNLLSTIRAPIGPRYDVCLCVAPPITVGLTGLLVQRLRGTPLVFVVQDVWPDCLEAIGQLRNPALIRTFRLVERIVYRKAARLVAVSEGMKEYLVTGKGVPAGKIAVIPNWADVQAIKPLPKDNAFRERHGLSDRFLVLFAGNIGFVSHLETVVEAANLLRGNSLVKILIVGEGNAKPELLRRAAELKLDNVLFLPRQPEEVVPQMLAACDLGLVTLHQKLGRLNVPSKTYPIMASARPVVAAVGQDSEVFRVISEGNCGFWVPPDDGPALADTIRSLACQPERLDWAGQNGRRYVEEHFTRERAVARYSDVLHEAAAKPEPRLSRSRSGESNPKVSQIKEDPVAGLRFSTKRTPRSKRWLDFVLASLMLVFSAPVFAILSVLIKLQDGGPVFFIQERWGRGGRPFRIWKFRTMVPRAGSDQASPNDPRITRIGRLLRRSGLDELPQLVSILLGKMSFVGPRPLAINEIVRDRHGRLLRYEDVRGFDSRLAVLPGLTGLATVFIPKESLPCRKFRYDLLYVRKQSLSLDLRLIALSFLMSFAGKWEVPGERTIETRMRSEVRRQTGQARADVK